MQQGKVISTKQLKINKANSMIVIILSICSFLFVFSLVASKTLISQYAYQSRVTNALQNSVDKLSADKQAATPLINSYNTFVNQSSNIIGGSATGTGNQDGNNTKIILDALPNKYDFPALATSIQNLLSVPGVTISSISGTDEGSSSATIPTTTTPATTSTSTTTTPATTSTTTSSSGTAPIAIPFSFSVAGSYSAVNSVLTNLQRSIRPIQIQSIDITGSDNAATMSVTAQTYYLPAVGLSLNQETIK